jgi:DNA-binding transcriptional LysR family regulator
MDRFLEMQTFAAVVDAGSFVRAAESLGLSKAAASRHVADLEERLGVRLLHRTTRRLSLTAEGEIFHLRCRELLEELAEAEGEITSRSGEAVGQLKLNVPVSFGILHLAHLWPGFLARHPGVMLDVTLNDRTVDLVDEGYDLAVRIGSLQDSSLVSRQLASTRLVLCATPDYLRTHGQPTHPHDLARHPVISYRLLSARDLWSFEGPEGTVRVEVTPRILTNNGDTCRAAALQHLGLVLQPDFLVGADLRSGALVEVLPAYRAPEYGVYAVYPTRKHVSPKVRLLIEYLVEAFRVPGWLT